MLLTDFQTCNSDVSHLSISTKTYWWHQLLSNGGNLFIHLIHNITHSSGLKLLGCFCFPYSEIFKIFNECFVTDLYETLLSNCLYPRLRNNSEKFTVLIFSVY